MVDNLDIEVGDVMDGRGMGAESRELVAGCGRGFGSKSGLGRDGDAMEGQGVVGDATFRDSERDVTREGTRHDEDGDAKAWQGESEDREAGDQG
jgi:hypothetical protein